MTSPKPTDSEQLHNLAAFIVDYEFQAPRAKYSNRQELIAKYTQMITAYMAQRDQQRLSAVLEAFPAYMTTQDALELGWIDSEPIAFNNALAKCRAVLTAALSPDNSKIEE